MHVVSFCPLELHFQEEIFSNMSKLGEMQDEHTRLMGQQEVLQAELQSSYLPQTIIGLGGLRMEGKEDMR